MSMANAFLLFTYIYVMYVMIFQSGHWPYMQTCVEWLCYLIIAFKILSHNVTLEIEELVCLRLTTLESLYALLVAIILNRVAYVDELL
jgi:hypothetical protein